MNATLTLPYTQVDVFTDRPFGGNALAVVRPPVVLPKALMQQIAREFNLSETTFIGPPRNPAHTARVRVFTTSTELPFAGHPTLGTAFVLAQEQAVGAPGTMTLEMGVGPVVVTVRADGALSMAQLPPTFGTIRYDHGHVAAALCLPPSALREDMPVQVVSVGVPHTMIPLRTRALLAAASLRHDVWQAHFAATDASSFYPFALEAVARSHHVEARLFAPGLGVPAEDPATGSAAGPLGAYLVRYGHAQPGATVVVGQGFAVGRPSTLAVTVEADGGPVHVAGRCVIVGTGTITIPKRWAGTS